MSGVENFFWKDHILGFEGHVASVGISEFCCCSAVV